MNKYVKKLVDGSNARFRRELDRQKKFFSKPDVLVAIVTAAVALLGGMLEKKPKKSH